VREARGTIDCQSTLGVGSTFTVLLPLETRVPQAQRAEIAEAPEVRGAVVLVVDDEPLVRNVVRQLLKRDACTVLEAASANAAREVLQRGGSKVDLVILDQSMPGETGVEALPSLRELTGAPIVLFTGMAPTLLPTGFTALLEKPARPAELQRMIREVLGNQRMHT
jgi:CheY-like chemotaxis protein